MCPPKRERSTLLWVSGGFLDCWVTGSGWSSGVFWAPGSGSVGFRRTGWCAQGWAESLKPSADARGCELGGVAESFPGQALVVDEPAGQAQLGVGGDDQPGPAVGLVGGLQRWCGPAEGAFDEAEGVLDVEAAQVGTPAEVEVGFARSGPPQPQRLAWAGGGAGGRVHAAGHTPTAPRAT